MSFPVSSTADLHARPTSPYKGLASFEDSEFDELLFFGRGHEREVIAANLVATRLTVLYGPSGVGKSSVLRAGVARDLRAFPEQPLVIVCDGWADSPDAVLASAIADAARIPQGPLSETVEVASALYGDIYLLLDQVEEYFVYHGGDPALGDALAELVMRSELPVHVLISIREDALARLDSFKRRLPGLLANRLRLDHLSVDAGRHAIVGPIERFGALVPEEEGLAIESELVDAVLAGVLTGVVVQPRRGRGASRAARRHDRIETPYLQVVMQRLWEVEREQGSRTLRYRTLEELGGPARIVEDHLERALTTLTREQKGLAARMFNYLVTPSGMKIAHRTHDLAGWTAASEAELEPVLTALGRERILRPVRSDGPDVAHEIFHDVLADAVLAWRAAFEAEEALRRERAAARRRRRRFIVFVAVSLVALATMAAVTLYALEQRSTAERNATDAQAAKADAQRQLTRANESVARLRVTERNMRLAQHEVFVQALLATRRLYVLQGGAGPVRSGSFSPDGRLVVITDASDARVFDAGTGRAVSTIHTGTRVRSAMFSPDGGTILTAFRGRHAELWDPRTGNREGSFAHGGAATTAVFSADGRLVVTTGGTNARIWDVATLSSRRGFRANTTVRRAVLSPDGSRLLIIADDSAVVFDVATRAHLFSLPQSSRVTAARFSPQGNVMVTTGVDHTVQLWNVQDGSLRCAALPGAGDLATLGFSHDGRWLVTADTQANSRVWNTSTCQLAMTLVDSESVAAEFSPDDHLIVTAGSDGSARLFSFPDGEQQAKLLGHTEALTSASFSPDGTKVVTGSNDGTARLWNAEIDQLLQPLGTHQGPARGLAFSPDAKTLASVGADGDVRLWDLATRSVRATLAAGVPLNGVAFSPDGGSVAAAGSDGVTRIWSVATRLVTAQRVQRGAALAVAYSPNGAWLATAGDDHYARVWHVGGGKPMLLAHPGVVSDVAFSPDSRFVATAGEDGLARLWNRRTGALVRTYTGHLAGISSVAFSPDGSRLLTTSLDHDARIWDVATASTRRVLHGHAAFVSDGGFSADGNWVVTAGPGKAAVWSSSGTGSNLPSFRLFFLAGHHGAVTAAAFAARGWMLATAGSDGAINTYMCALCARMSSARPHGSTAARRP